MNHNNLPELLFSAGLIALSAIALLGVIALLVINL